MLEIFIPAGWLPRHMGPLNLLGIGGPAQNLTALRHRYFAAVKGIAKLCRRSKRTVERCYAGRPVRSTTRELVTQAARILGYGEPPGSLRLSK